MTANGDLAAGTNNAAAATDENNRNVDNTKPLASEAIPMDVDIKPEENLNNDAASSSIIFTAPEKEEDPRELHERKAKQFVRELYRFHENAG